MNTVFMSYYSHMAKLATVSNKQTLFLAHLLYRAEYDEVAKQSLVSLSAFDKRKILKEIGCISKNPLKLAGHYLYIIEKSGLIKGIGGSAYLIDPASFSSFVYVPKEIRGTRAVLYETRVFTEKTNGVEEAWIVTEDGERIDL